jgi:hypothetical protein
MTARRNVPSNQLTMFMVIEAKPKPLTEGQIDDLFREFYRSYPKHKAVKDARKAFTAAIKEAAFGDIMQGVDRYAADIERQGTRPEYIAYPATWLRAGRWADEPDAAPTNSTTASFARIGLEFRAAGGVRR